MLPKSHRQDGLNFAKLLRPYAGSLSIALLAVMGEGSPGWLEPWPLKIVFDSVSGAKPLPRWFGQLPSIRGYLDRRHPETGGVGVLAIAILEAAVLLR